MIMLRIEHPVSRRLVAEVRVKPSMTLVMVRRLMADATGLVEAWIIPFKLLHEDGEGESPGETRAPWVPCDLRSDTVASLGYSNGDAIQYTYLAPCDEDYDRLVRKCAAEERGLRRKTVDETDSSKLDLQKRGGDKDAETGSSPHDDGDVDDHKYFVKARGERRPSFEKYAQFIRA